MAFRAEYDDTELRRLEVDLRGAPARVQRRASVEVDKAGDLVQRGMRRQASGHRSLRHLPKSITREMLGPYEVEVGYDTHVRGAQGRLAHIIVYGSVNNAPQWDHTVPLRNATPRILQRLAEAGEESVLGDEG